MLPSAQAREGILRIRATGERDKRETSVSIKVRMTLLKSRNMQGDKEVEIKVPLI